MKHSYFKRFPLCFLILIGTAGCPMAMSPVGAPSNPAGIAAPDKSDLGDTPSGGASDGANYGSSSGTSGSGTGTPPPPNGPPNGPPINIVTPPNGTSVAMAQGGTFCPKGDGETMGDDLLKTATDWRLRFGINTWWELSRTVPEPFPVFKNSKTDFDMKLEAQLPECGWILVFGPTLHMVYQPKDQPPSAAQSFDAVAQTVSTDGSNVSFVGLALGEGTVTFTVDLNGTHALGTLTTYYGLDPSVISAPILSGIIQSK